MDEKKLNSHSYRRMEDGSLFRISSDTRQLTYAMHLFKSVDGGYKEFEYLSSHKKPQDLEEAITNG